jgi:replication factor C subunit 3/5
MSGYVWVEKYRPTEFDDIVLEPLNKQILKNIVNTGYFPNLLFYGPPGTGKTTTIINLINAYQEKLNNNKKELIIHLNASDERGIDIIRNQINFFVNSKPLFNNGMKFIILDEVDYMTKNAQQALRYLLQNYTSSVRFCLICNYISKIDEGLQNEFMRLRFNQLPEDLINKYLTNISIKENLNLNEESINHIQTLFKSDIRSMINFMQSNQDLKNDTNFKIIKNEIWDNILDMLKAKVPIEQINKYIHEISINYNVDKKNIIKNFLNYIIRIRNNIIPLTNTFLNYVENIMHNQNLNNNNYVNYTLSALDTLL